MSNIFALIIIFFRKPKGSKFTCTLLYIVHVLTVAFFKTFFMNPDPDSRIKSDPDPDKRTRIRNTTLICNFSWRMLLGGRAHCEMMLSQKRETKTCLQAKAKTI